MTRHTFETMGTVVSLELERERAVGAILARVQAVFRRYDERFSLYRSDSELSRVATGDLALADSSDQLRWLYAVSLEWRSSTAGAFTPHRPDGVIDLSGIVKAVAIREVGVLLEATAARHWFVDVGGDILASGADRTIGVVDPGDRTSLLATIALGGSRRAVATSGIAERGEHIWTADAGTRITQATVVADDIVTADVLATAIVAGGYAFLDEATARFDIDVLTVDAAGALRATPGMRTAMGVAA